MKNLKSKVKSVISRARAAVDRMATCVKAAITRTVTGTRYALANNRAEGFVDSGGASVRA